ncbi:coiled-coil domain-containing protein, putative [Ixodes scapularis]|uniref:Coiled-coil domain-containing protein 43 n=1 Tax=Ixodes scapularis TaxID=6945 RepID=B7P8L0_IXOSC|nr:coiled-coil domain-containing protein, putative [Ixodes scapularis]|eukprot:XP_002402446.1 coiled-coil domain-containing protein, putative [Ixodes scapularis]
MAALCGDFELWLADKLRALSIDPDVFGSYITGILEGTETEEEKSEALQGILSEVCEDGISEVKDEIFSKWSAYTQSPAEGDVRVDDEAS